MEKETIEKIFDNVSMKIKKYLLDGFMRCADLKANADGNLDVRGYINDVISLVVNMVEFEKSLAVTCIDELRSRGVTMKPSFKELLDTAIVVKTQEEVKRDLRRQYIS